MTTEATDDRIHLVFIPVDGPRPQCDGSGPCTMRIDEVTCPDCLQMYAARDLRMDTEPVVHDAHAIPAGDEPKPATVLKPGEIYSINGDPDDLMLVLSIGDSLRFLPFREDETYLLGDIEGTDGPLTRVFPPPAAGAKSCPSCSRCGETFHVESAKTHDLTVRPDATSAIRTLIAVENEADDYRLYLLTDAAKMLGRMLTILTPAQVAILAAALTDGAL